METNEKWLRKQVGAKIREAREIELEMSQGELGEALGVANSLVSRYERGAAPVPKSKLEQIAKMAKKDIAWFYGVEHSSDPIVSPGIYSLELDAILQEALRKANMAFAYLLGGMTAQKRETFVEDLKAGRYAPLELRDLDFCKTLAMNDPNVPVWALVLHLRQIQEIRRRPNHGE